VGEAWGQAQENAGEAHPARHTCADSAPEIAPLRLTPLKTAAGPLRDFGERYTAAWCSQGVAAFFSTDGSLSINGGAPAAGRDSIREVVQGFMTAFPDLVLTMDDVRVEGDRAVYHWTFAGTNTGRPAPGSRCCSAGSRSGRSVRTD